MSGAPLELLRAAVERTRVLTEARPTTGRTHDAADDTTGTFATDSALRFDRALTVPDPDGFEVHYLRRADLNRMRRGAGRPKDLRRVDEFERA